MSIQIVQATGSAIARAPGGAHRGGSSLIVTATPRKAASARSSQVGQVGEVSRGLVTPLHVGSCEIGHRLIIGVAASVEELV